MGERQYFRYWRARVEFAAGLDSEHRHEGHVLTWAALDGLAFAWTQAFNQRQPWAGTNRLRFGRFLGEFCPDFARVSLPSLWQRTSAAERTKLRGELPEWFEGFRSSPGERAGRLIEEDPMFTDLHTEVQRRWPTEGVIPLASKMEECRIGTLAYTRMRNGFMHEGRAGNQTHGFELAESEFKPTYLGGRFQSPPILGFDLRLMSKTLNTCLDGFERLAEQQGIDPTPAAYV